MVVVIPGLAAAQRTPWRSTDPIAAIPRAELDAITERGRLMFDYYFAAGRAIEALKALTRRDELLRSYIARRNPDGTWDVVLGLLNARSDTFRISFRAIQSAADPTAFTTYEMRPPSADVGYYARAARALHVCFYDFGAGSRPYNWFVVPVAGRDEWYVYFLPAATVPGVWPHGGDIRYRVSADGRRILERHRMHNSTLEVSVMITSDSAHLLGMHRASANDRPEDSDVAHVLIREPRMPELIESRSYYFAIDLNGRIMAFNRDSTIKPPAPAATPSASAVSSIDARGWDPSPLRTSTPVPNDGLPRDQAGFFQWLSQSGSRLSEVEAQRARERIYVYVSEMAKSRGGQFPTAGDSTAIRLFRSAVSAGVAGADQILQALDRRTLPDALSPVPPGLRLSFQPPTFMLGSDDGTWSVCFPYYFMASPVGRQTLANGVATELATLSTLFAPDRGAPGSSQATILIAAAPVADSARHVALWLEQLGVNRSRNVDRVRPGEWFAASAQDGMQREVVVLRLPNRVILVAYLGLPGTFEANRPHFLDLLRTLSPQRCAA